MFADRMRRFLLVLLAMVLMPSVALAHPMGNFSVNHYTKITLEAHTIRLQFILDLAEIPTYQELQQGNLTATPDSAAERYAHSRGEQLEHELVLTYDGKVLPMQLRSSSVLFPPGAGGLPTMKMGFVYEAAEPTGGQTGDAQVHFRDDSYPGHQGWKEIIAVAHGGTLLKSSVASVDRSAGLTDYPTDLLSNPPQDLEASLVAAPPVVAAAVPASPVPVPQPAAALPVKHTQPVAAAPAIRPLPAAVFPPVPEAVTAPLVLHANQQKTPRNRFTELITAQRLSPWFLFTAVFIAMGLGALHALEPGHGKTIVAAYLVGSRGTARHAALLGLIVTVSHTAGVFALGAVTLYASRYIVPEQLYPWLSILSGLTIAALGIYIVLQRATGTAVEHTHLEGTTHGLWPFSKAIPLPDAPVVAGRSGVGYRQLVTLGVTGGIIPCPAALIVLLSAFALHRVALGLLLIVAFSVGLAAVLILFGMAMVYARRFMTHLQVDGPLTKRWLPVASATFMTLLGVAIVVQALIAMNLRLHLPSLTRETLGPALFVTGLGLLLGMRHSTDADHIVALSTIISKQRSIKHAAVIGSLWGVGHTITIFAVGSLIILFNVRIPPRIGLAMEFSVAIMLIVLGLLNLTGLLQRVPAWFGKMASQSKPGLIQTSPIFPDSLRQTYREFGLYQCVRPVVIGLVHGLAGSAAVALLVLSTIHSPLWATVYLLIFGLGTIVGMMIMTTMIAVPLTYGSKRFSKLSGYLATTSGLVSVCFGSFLVYQLGFLGGLFTQHPHWTPQ